jgi:transcription-repair coupling factor (superfamily II helicase)
MQEIGFNLYNDMLNHAVKALKEGREPDLAEPFGVTTEINLHLPALLPDAYCGDVHERLTLYKRLANCETQEALDAMHEELIDRFGLLPEPAQTLLESHRLRVASRALGVARIDATAEQLQLQFVKTPPLDGAKVIALIGRQRNWRLQGPDRLRIEAPSASLEERVRNARAVLKTLAQAA